MRKVLVCYVDLPLENHSDQMRPEGNILLLTCTSLWLDQPDLLHILTLSILTDHHLYHAASQKKVITNVTHCSHLNATFRIHRSGVCHK